MLAIYTATVVTLKKEKKEDDFVPKNKWYLLK